MASPEFVTNREFAAHSKRRSRRCSAIAYPDIALKGAVLCYLIAEGQGFLDGNKRTGFHAAVTFFALNGGELVHDRCDFQAMDEYMRSLSGRTYDEIATWFRTFVDGI